MSEMSHTPDMKPSRHESREPNPARSHARSLLERARQAKLMLGLVGVAGFASAEAAPRPSESRPARPAVEHQYENRAASVEITGFERTNVSPELIRRAIIDILGANIVEGSISQVNYVDENRDYNDPSYHGSGSDRQEMATTTRGRGQESAVMTIRRACLPEQMNYNQLFVFLSMLIHETTHAAIDPEDANWMNAADREELMAILNRAGDESRHLIEAYAEDYHSDPHHPEGTASVQARRRAEYLAEFIRDVVTISYDNDITAAHADWHERTLHQLARSHQRTVAELQPESDLLHFLNDRWQHDSNFLSGAQGRFQQLLGQYAEQGERPVREQLAQRFFGGIQNETTRNLLSASLTATEADFREGTQFNAEMIRAVSAHRTAPSSRLDRAGHAFTQEFQRLEDRIVRSVEDEGLRNEMMNVARQMVIGLNIARINVHGEASSHITLNTANQLQHVMQSISQQPAADRAAAERAFQTLLQLNLHADRATGQASAPLRQALQQFQHTIQTARPTR